MAATGVDKVYGDAILGYSLKGMDTYYIIPTDEVLTKTMEKYTKGNKRFTMMTNVMIFRGWDLERQSLQNNGGSAWESNPPGTVLAPHTGFEVREPHQ